MLKIKLNGTILEVEPDKKIVELVNDKDCIAARINGELRDLSMPITENCEIELIHFDNPEGQQIFWHSTSHIMAMAVKALTTLYNFSADGARHDQSQIFAQAKDALDQAISDCLVLGLAGYSVRIDNLDYRHDPYSFPKEI